MHSEWGGAIVLQLYRSGDLYSVWKFFDPDGSFRHWYINFEAPLKRGPGYIDTNDYGLDLSLTPRVSGVGRTCRICTTRGPRGASLRRQCSTFSLRRRTSKRHWTETSTGGLPGLRVSRCIRRRLRWMSLPRARSASTHGCSDLPRQVRGSTDERTSVSRWHVVALGGAAAIADSRAQVAYCSRADDGSAVDSPLHPR